MQIKKIKFIMYFFQKLKRFKGKKLKRFKDKGKRFIDFIFFKFQIFNRVFIKDELKMRYYMIFIKYNMVQGLY